MGRFVIERETAGFTGRLTLFVESKCRPVRVIEYSTRQVSTNGFFGARTISRALVYESKLDKFQTAIVMKAKEVAEAMHVELKVVDLCKQRLANKILRRFTRRIEIPSLLIPERLWTSFELDSVLREIVSLKDSMNLENLGLLHLHITQNSGEALTKLYDVPKVPLTV